MSKVSSIFRTSLVLAALMKASTAVAGGNGDYREAGESAVPDSYIIALVARTNSQVNAYAEAFLTRHPGASTKFSINNNLVADDLVLGAGKMYSKISRNSGSTHWIETTSDAVRSVDLRPNGEFLMSGASQGTTSFLKLVRSF